MPVIRQYTAEGRAETLRLPARPPVEDYNPLATIGINLARAGENIGAIGGYLAELDARRQKVADDLEVSRLTGIVNERLGTLKNDLEVDPTPVTDSREFQNRFRQGAQKILTDVRKESEANPRVNYRVTQNYYRAVPALSVAVHETGIRKQTVQMVGRLDEYLDIQANVAASALDNDQARLAIAQGKEKLDEFRQQGFLNDVEYGKRLRTLRDNTNDRRADMLAEDLEVFSAAVDKGYFSDMPRDRLQHWQRVAVERADQKEAKKEKETRRVHEIIKGTLVNQAALGILEEQPLAEALSVGAITQKEADAFRGVSLNPPDARMDNAVALINDRFVQRELSKESIARTRAEYKALLLDSGRRNDKLSEQLDRLNRLDMSVESSDSAQFRQDFEMLMSEWDTSNPEILNASPLEIQTRKNQRTALRERLFQARAEGRKDVLEIGRTYIKQLAPGPKDPTEGEKLEEKIRGIYKNLPPRR